MKYIVYYEFVLEVRDIELAEKEAQDITEKWTDSRVHNSKLTVRETS